MTVLNLVEHARALVCATPKGDKPAPKGKPEKKAPKIPVPKIKINRKNDGSHANNLTAQAIKAQAAKDKSNHDVAKTAAWCEALTGVADDLDLPAELDRKKNGITADDWKDFKPTPLPAPTTTPEAQTLLAEQAAAKKTKAQVRAEKKAAAAAGASKTVPLTGKAALAAIAKDAVENGKAKVVKVPPGVSGTALSKDPKERTKQVAKLARKGTPARSPGYARLKASGKAEALRKETAAMQRAATQVNPAKAASSSGKSKTDIARELMSRKNGATRAEIVAATDWPSINLKPIAKRADKKLVKKDGRYFLA